MAPSLALIYKLSIRVVVSLCPSAGEILAESGETGILGRARSRMGEILLDWMQGNVDHCESAFPGFLFLGGRGGGSPA